jgi:HK97 family phage prohead protease
MEKRQYKQGQLRAFLEDDRTVSFVISDESVDRHNSIIKSDAWDLEPFKENPIAGWGHEVYGGWRAPDPDNIIGGWRNLRIEDNELIGELAFEDEQTNPKAEKIYRKVKSGTLNSVSVGFLPKKSHVGDPEKTKGEIEGVHYYDDVELVEVSIVPIPSNKNARKKALENGDIPELIEELVREALGDEYREDLTLKGLFAILRGDEAEKIEEAETGDKIDKEAREVHLKKVEAFNNYIELQEKFDNEQLNVER